jgi:hypothetical protein
MPPICPTRSSSRSLRLGAAAALLLAALAVDAAAAAPGVGFDPQALGLRTSHYWVQDPVTGRLSQRSHVIDWSVAAPFASQALFERRWGPGSYTRKKWVGPDNELVATVKAAMEWAYGARPDLLGASLTGFDGRATAVEVTDACATGNGTSIVVAYAQAEWPGASPDRRIEISDPTKPGGDFSEKNPYWPLTMYYHNTVRRFLPVSPQVEIPPGE